MKLFNSPYLRIIISLVQIYLALQFLGVIPGVRGVGTVFAYLIGGVLLIGGGFGLYQAINRRARAESVELSDQDLDEIEKLVSEGKQFQAMTLVRQKTGATIAEAKAAIESVRQNQKNSKNVNS